MTLASSAPGFLKQEARNARSFAAWLARFTRRVFYIVRIRTTLIVLATVVSQISFIVAFFMPIKILFVLQGDRVPRYFPEAVRDVDRNDLVVAMTVISLAAFGLHNLLNYIIKRLTESSTLKIVEVNQKISINTDIEEKIRQSYSSYSSALANLVFLVTSLTVLAIIYPLVFTLLFSIYALLVVVFIVLSRASRANRDMLVTGLPKFLKPVSNIGFLIVFLGILVDFLSAGGPNLIVALVSILFARQSLSKSSSTAKSLLSLFQQRSSLDIAFYPENTSTGHPTTRPNSVWQLLLGKDWTTLATQILVGKFSPDELSVHSVTWSDSSRFPAVDLSVEVTVSGTTRSFLFRFFPEKRKDLARKERLLLGLKIEGLPAPEMVYETTVKKCEVSVLDVTGLTSIPSPSKELGRRVQQEIEKVRLPRFLITNYRLSNLSLRTQITPHRLGAALQIAERSGLYVTDEEVRTVLKMAQEIDGLPLKLHNPFKSLTEVRVDPCGNYFLLNWCDWSLIPNTDHGGSYAHPEGQPGADLTQSPRELKMSAHLLIARGQRSAEVTIEILNSLSRLLQKGDHSSVLVALRHALSGDPTPAEPGHEPSWTLSQEK